MMCREEILMESVRPSGARNSCNTAGTKPCSVESDAIDLRARTRRGLGSNREQNLEWVAR